MPKRDAGADLLTAIEEQIKATKKVEASLKWFDEQCRRELRQKREDRRSSKAD